MDIKKLFRPTRTVAPLVLAIIGGVIGIISGIVWALAGETIATFTSGFGIITAMGYLILVVSIAAIVGGSVSKKLSWGPWTLMLSGIFMLIFVIILCAKIGTGGVPFAIYLWLFSYVIITLLGGILALCLPKKDGIAPKTKPAATEPTAPVK